MLATALAVMPLQGIAATLTVLLCHGDAQAHAAHAAASHGHGGHSHYDAAAVPEQPGATGGDDGSAADMSPFHLCCNLTASAPPMVTVTSDLPEFSVRMFVPGTLHDLFVPDQPQRPPLV